LERNGDFAARQHIFEYLIRKDVDVKWGVFADIGEER